MRKLRSFWVVAVCAIFITLVFNQEEWKPPSVVSELNNGLDEAICDVCYNKLKKRGVREWVGGCLGLVHAARGLDLPEWTLQVHEEMLKFYQQTSPYRERIKVL